jgi:protein-disulfide isomerase
MSEEMIKMPVTLRSVTLALVCGMAAAWFGATAKAGDSNPPPQRQQIEAIIHEYLLQHPDVLIAALRRAEDKLHKDDDAKASQAVADHHREVFNDPSTPVGGNPRGDATIVEFFDYRCPYCKQVEPSLEAMLRQDPNLRLVYKEFPILGPVSVTASRAALAAQRQGKYDAFHDAMMEARGNITDDTVYRIAGSVGLNVDELKHDMASPELAQRISENLKLAKALEIGGTPAFVIGDKVVPGAADIGTLKSMVADARKK